MLVLDGTSVGAFSTRDGEYDADTKNELVELCRECASHRGSDVEGRIVPSYAMEPFEPEDVNGFGLRGVRRVGVCMMFPVTPAGNCGDSTLDGNSLPSSTSL